MAAEFAFLLNKYIMTNIRHNMHVHVSINQHLPINQQLPACRKVSQSTSAAPLPNCYKM